MRGGNVVSGNTVYTSAIVKLYGSREGQRFALCASRFWALSFPASRFVELSFPVSFPASHFVELSFRVSFRASHFVSRFALRRAFVSRFFSCFL